MRFELDNILIDEILFHMENQDGDFLFDTQERIIIDLYNDLDDEEEDDNTKEDVDYNSDRYISLPEWSSGDGYRLMERFAASLKNPVLREELSGALNRSRGVFRAFRDVLNQYPETEKQWFRYKEQEMKYGVIAWYNALREEWGLEPVGCEPEDNTSLVLEDFVIKEEIKENGVFCFIAQTSSGEFAGTANAVIDGGTLQINKLEVEAEYRGMGIAKTLLARMAEKADCEKLDVMIDLPSESNYFSRSLHLENFKPCMQRFIRKR